MTNPVIFHGHLSIGLNQVYLGKSVVINSDQNLSDFAKNINLQEESILKLKNTLDLSNRTIIFLHPQENYGLYKAEQIDHEIHVDLVQPSDPVGHLMIACQTALRMLVLSVKKTNKLLNVFWTERQLDSLKEPEFGDFKESKLLKPRRLQRIQHTLGDQVYYEIMMLGYRKNPELLYQPWFVKFGPHRKKVAIKFLKAACVLNQQSLEKDDRTQKVVNRVMGKNLLNPNC